jgi:hypothetical protein
MITYFIHFLIKIGCIHLSDDDDDNELNEQYLKKLKIIKEDKKYS